MTRDAIGAAMLGLGIAVAFVAYNLIRRLRNRRAKATGRKRPPPGWN